MQEDMTKTVGNAKYVVPDETAGRFLHLSVCVSVLHRKWWESEGGGKGGVERTHTSYLPKQIQEKMNFLQQKVVEETANQKL